VLLLHLFRTCIVEFALAIGIAKLIIENYYYYDSRTAPKFKKSVFTIK
jgi:hypothetical protein